jgi:predicted Zn-dependent protease with MMP-like domain
LDRQRFEWLVAKAVDSQPTPHQLRALDRKRGETLLGLYEGVPLTRRSRHYGLVAPDKITIFQKPIESICRNDAETVNRIQRVVLHEIAHHFGISDARLKELGMD